MILLVRISDSSIQLEVLSGEDFRICLAPTWMLRCYWSYMTSMSFPNVISETTSDTAAT